MKEEYMTVNKFKGSWGWMIFWIFVFWPIAIVYYFMKKRPVKVKIEHG